MAPKLCFKIMFILGTICIGSIGINIHHIIHKTAIHWNILGMALSGMGGTLLLLQAWELRKVMKS